MTIGVADCHRPSSVSSLPTVVTCTVLLLLLLLLPAVAPDSSTASLSVAWLVVLAVPLLFLRRIQQTIAMTASTIAMTTPATMPPMAAWLSPLLGLYTH